MKAKRFFGVLLVCFCISSLNAQITIMDNVINEKIVTKPEPFDSLSNVMMQKDPIQYKKYIGYKLYSLPLSNKFECEDKDCNYYALDFRYKSGTVKKIRIPISPYRVTTDVYNATFSAKAHRENGLYTPYESIQNTYFTILDVEISGPFEEGVFSSLEDWNNKGDFSPDFWVLRFTLKNETSGEDLYWIINGMDLSKTTLFLVPYFEKMQKLYKGKNVVSMTNLNKLVEITSGEEIAIKSEEVWKCYDVTFVNLKDAKWVKPYLFLEKDGKKVKVEFSDFTKKNYDGQQTFVLESDYNEMIAQKQRAADERRKIEEEKKRLEEIARQERNRNIMQKFGNEMGTLICEGKVCLQMNKEMCQAAWGEPISINSTIIEGKVFEQWVYGWKTYLYFENDILKTIQN